MTNVSSAQPVQVKICGLTRPDDALLAVEAGASFLGLIFVPNTPRCLTIAQAQTITSAVQNRFQSDQRRPRFVGVFRDQSQTDIDNIVSQLPLDFIQLHGNESAELANVMPLPVIRFAPLTENWMTTVSGLSPFVSLLLEPQKGSGLTLMEWLYQSPAIMNAIKSVGRQFPLLLAGGLTPDNISTVLKTLKDASACPFALDVASGVESGPGIKDAGKVRQFCQLATSFQSDAQVIF